jgi:hypothetical protein
MSRNEPHNAKRIIDLDQLLHPARAFEHPMQVALDPSLTLPEKRAILSSWASDACALEAAHELRMHVTGAQARWDDIMDALRHLDDQVDRSPSRSPKKPWWRKRRFGGRSGGDPNSGAEAP